MANFPPQHDMILFDLAWSEPVSPLFPTVDDGDDGDVNNVTPWLSPFRFVTTAVSMIQMQNTQLEQEQEEQNHHHFHHSWSVLLWSACFLYLLSEVAFYLYFHYHLIPQANIRNPQPELYYDYPTTADRIQLCRRIFNRLAQKAARRAATTGQDPTYCHQQVIREFCLPWFECIPTLTAKNTTTLTPSQPQPQALLENKVSHKNEEQERPPPLTLVSMTSTSSSTTFSGSCSNSSVSSSNSNSCTNEDANSVQSSSDDDGDGRGLDANALPLRPLWKIQGLRRPAVVQFFSWAFFAKDQHDLTDEEREAVERDCFDVLREYTGLVMDDGDDDNYDHGCNNDKDNHHDRRTLVVYEPRRLSLENVQAMHRPWLVYAAVAVSQVFQKHVLLPWLGFRQVVSNETTRGIRLKAWYRPAAASNELNKVCLFFHGLAPSGLICYMPMLEAILGKQQKEALLMFENPSIVCQFHALPHFEVLTEQDTVLCVKDLLRKLQLDHDACQLTLMGHSFGSCPVTWILRRRQEFAARIHHVVLLDPVTLLLSEPTVMTRFLYDRHDRAKAHIRFIVASELFTEFYLRRHFCWYNSELWLEDFCCSPNKNGNDNDPAQWTIVLSGCDEIVPSPVVREHVEHLQKNCNLKKCNLVYWTHAKHANCVMSPFRWNTMRQFLFCENDNNNNTNTSNDDQHKLLSDSNKKQD